MRKMDISGYGQNVLGAMTVAIIAGVAWCVRNKFKHSNCELDSGCLKVTSHEDDEGRNTIRREILDQLRAEGVIPGPIAVSETNLYFFLKKADCPLSKILSIAHLQRVVRLRRLSKRDCPIREPNLRLCKLVGELPNV